MYLHTYIHVSYVLWLNVNIARSAFSGHFKKQVNISTNPEHTLSDVESVELLIENPFLSTTTIFRKPICLSVALCSNVRLNILEI